MSLANTPSAPDVTTETTVAVTAVAHTVGAPARGWRALQARRGVAPTSARFVVVSALLHAVAFAVAGAVWVATGERSAPPTLATTWTPPAPALAPEPETPPDAPPIPERPDDEIAEAADEPDPLDAPWEPATIAVASSDGVALLRTPRARARVRGEPGGTGRGTGSGAGAGAASIAPATPEPPVVVVPEPPPHVHAVARAVHIVRPAYPDEARSSGVEGAVLVEVDVDAEGGVSDVRVLTSSGSPSLDRAAIAAVRRWRFTPATDDGVPVASVVRLPAIRFRLER
jgi:protein TonB